RPRPPRLPPGRAHLPLHHVPRQPLHHRPPPRHARPRRAARQRHHRLRLLRPRLQVRDRGGRGAGGSGDGGEDGVAGGVPRPPPLQCNSITTATYIHINPCPGCPPRPHTDRASRPRHRTKPKLARPAPSAFSSPKASRTLTGFLRLK